MENLIGKTNLVICSWYNVPTLFRNLQKEVFSGQGAWHSPNTHKIEDRHKNLHIESKLKHNVDHYDIWFLQ
jgi:hypothetical protein